MDEIYNIKVDNKRFKSNQSRYIQRIKSKNKNNEQFNDYNDNLNDF